MKFNLRGKARLNWHLDHDHSASDDFILPGHLTLDIRNTPENALMGLAEIMLRRRAQQLLHDASQPLSVIMNLTATLKKNPTLNDEGRADLAVLDEQTAYLKTMVEQLRLGLDPTDPALLEGLNYTGEFSFKVD